MYFDNNNAINSQKKKKDCASIIQEVVKKTEQFNVNITKLINVEN